MALSEDDIRSAAERLDRAEKTRTQIRQISLQHPGISIADAYAIQTAWIKMKVAGGLARQQDRAERIGAGSGSGGARGIVHPAHRDPQRRHDPGRLWRLRFRELLLRLTPT
jgi:hypothetical protein